MLGCASPPRQLDLADKPLGTEGSRDVGLQNLDCDLAMMLEVLGQVDDRHPTVAEHTLDCVAVSEGTSQAGEQVGAAGARGRGTFPS